MASLARAAAAIAAVLARESPDYAQSTASSKLLDRRPGCGCRRRAAAAWSDSRVEEELRFLDQAYARDGRTGLML